MPETATKPTLLEDLLSRRAKLGEDLDTLIDAREQVIAAFEVRSQSEKEDERPTDDERNADKQAEDDFRSASEDIEAELRAVNDRIDQQEKKAERRKVAEEAEEEVRSDVEVVSEPLTYRKDNAHEISYYMDLIATSDSLKGHVLRDWEPAEARLRTHAKETSDRLKKREGERRRVAEGEVEVAEREFRASLPRELRSSVARTLEASPFEARSNQIETRANPSRETGHGSEFVPPLWLVEDDWIPYLRAGRVIAPQLRNMPVPMGTDVIKVPKIKLGTEVAPQLMDNAGVASRDIETTYVEAPLKTLAGQEDVAIQLIEMSPGQVFDRVVQEDLLQDYNLKVDANISFAPGTNVTQLNAGTILGLFPATNWGTSSQVHTSSETKYTAQTLFAAMGCNWSWLAKERYNTQNVHHFINPRRAAFFASSTDAASETGRPFINAADFPNFNIGAELAEERTEAEGFVMRTPLGPEVFQTVNIPAYANEGATALSPNKTSEGSYTADYLLTVKCDDVWFFESDLRTRVLPEVVSGTLQIRYQVYAYVGLLVRYGPSIQVAGGKPFLEANTKIAGYQY
jgi:hypothetical protein